MDLTKKGDFRWSEEAHITFDKMKKVMSTCPVLALCNVPTLGHHHSAEVYDDQSSQMGVIESTGVIERHCEVQLAFLIIFSSL
jgi:hypothetical protein